MKGFVISNNETRMSVGVSAESLLSIQFHSFNYDDLFSAHNVLDLSYHSESAPVIETIPDSFDLGVGCIGESTVQVLKIRNLGTHPLNVYNIMSSCSCIKHLSPVNEAVVGSDEEFEFAFMFTPDRTGDLLREIYIVSDSYQKPLVTIPVTCQVK